MGVILFLSQGPGAVAEAQPWRLPIEFSYQWQPSREVFLLNPTFSLSDKSKGIYLQTTVFLEIPITELPLQYLNFIFVNNTMSVLSPYLCQATGRDLTVFLPCVGR